MDFDLGAVVNSSQQIIQQTILIIITIDKELNSTNFTSFLRQQPLKSVIQKYSKITLFTKRSKWLEVFVRLGF